MTSLNLIAFDADDLAVISAHTQDAVLQVGDMTYLPAEKRFLAVLRRFDWSGAAADPENLIRRQSVLHFERVLAARTNGLDLAQSSDVKSLLAIRFEPRGVDDPAGQVTLVFAGDGAVRLDVECIEAVLRDLGPAWETHAKPDHSDATRTDAATKPTKTP